MKPKYDEKVEIIPKLDGTLVCSISWNGLTFQEDLPKGIDRWSKAEFKSHLTSFIIPKLRVQLLKAQKAALDDGSVEPADCFSVIELSAQDIDRINKAEEKRAKRAAKRKLALN